MPPPIIALIGVDGAGKSTQARELVTWLHEQGLPAAHFTNPSGRGVLDRLSHKVSRRDAHELLGPAHVPLEAIVRWLAIARALLVSRVTGRIAVMDRYVYCQYALARARGSRGERGLRAVFACFPEPDVVCLLSVPPDVAHQRVERRGRDHEDLGYLAAFDAAYRSLPEVGSFHLVDGTAEPATVQRALRDVTEPALPEPGGVARAGP